VTKYHRQVVSIPDSHSDGLEFKSWSRDWVLWKLFFEVLFNSSEEIPGQYIKMDCVKILPLFLLYFLLSFLLLSFLPLSFLTQLLTNSLLPIKFVQQQCSRYKIRAENFSQTTFFVILQKVACFGMSYTIIIRHFSTECAERKFYIFFSSIAYGLR
jgi:hypothetical protein